MEGAAPGSFFLAGVLAVMAGNLLTVMLVAGWRAYTKGRRTDAGAPLWSSLALAFAGLLTGMSGLLFALTLIGLATAGPVVAP